ncbi:jg18042 [Pararge aegeria aegeria]|uniref:Jg18042 protein n=1 Tax=Pararge aegeria aegeria TaxID=348720 RepID=A0A8S4RH66_9NEOP|nr:jg18042 [Pararge aegeria aegeria]
MPWLLIITPMKSSVTTDLGSLLSFWSELGSESSSGDPHQRPHVQRTVLTNQAWRQKQKQKMTKPTNPYWSSMVGLCSLCRYIEIKTVTNVLFVMFSTSRW